MEKIMTKKIDRLRQWTSEKLGQEQKTQESEEFRELEMEINMRYEGTDRLHQSMALYVRNLSKRRELDEMEKTSPIDILGQSMSKYGEEFVADSTYGQALLRLGVANQKMARVQEQYVDRINRTFVEGIEKSLAQFKDFQNSRKRLESRRLAYDAALSKVQKVKREDARLEEEVRNQRIKYEEAGDDVVRKMSGIREAENENLMDVIEFFEAQCDYYEKCNDILQDLRKNWIADLPTKTSYSTTPKQNRNRSTSIKSYGSSNQDDGSPPPAARRPMVRSFGSSNGSTNETPIIRAGSYSLSRSQSVSSVDSSGTGNEAISSTSSISSLSNKFNGNGTSSNSVHSRFVKSVSENAPATAPRPSLGIQKRKLVKAVFKYEAEAADELSLEIGDIVTVTEEVDPGWWIGELVDSGSRPRSGLFPVPYTQVISEVNDGPTKPTKPSIMRKSSTFTTNDPYADDEDVPSRPPAVTAPSFQSSMKRIGSQSSTSSLPSYSSKGSIGGSASNGGFKKPPPPPPKRTGTIGAR
ncbi:hypothetical protein V1511DRAFT_487226 [Dipodascopsis uninucleata]